MFKFNKNRGYGLKCGKKNFEKYFWCKKHRNRLEEKNQRGNL